MKKFLKLFIFWLKIFSLIVEAAIVSRLFFFLLSANWKKIYIQKWSNKVLESFGVTIDLVNPENLSLTLQILQESKQDTELQRKRVTPSDVCVKKQESNRSKLQEQCIIEQNTTNFKHPVCEML